MHTTEVLLAARRIALRRRLSRKRIVAGPHVAPANSGLSLATRWKRFHQSQLRHIVQRAYETFTKLSPEATRQPGFHDRRDTVVRVVCISDTHDSHRRVPPLPIGDILIHAGDLTTTGSEFNIRKALRWLSSAPHPHKVFVAGNHDIALSIPATRDAILADFPKLTYLEDSGATVKVRGREITLYGTPRVPATKGNRGAFCTADYEHERWMKAIPQKTDILVTHGPPEYHRDALGRGCRHLRSVLWRVRPLLHVYGHIHAGYGVEHNRWGEEQYKYEQACRRGLGWRNALRLVYLAFLKALRLKPVNFKSHRHTLLVNASSVGKSQDRQRFRDPIVIDLPLPRKPRKVMGADVVVPR